MSNFNMQTDLNGKVRNLDNFYNNALLPIFEAVVNSIQSIEDSENADVGKITIKIIRDTSPQLFETSETGEELSPTRGVPALPPIIGFEISDNGLGFNDLNYESFLTSDSTLKIEKGCKGLGRFCWLKAFDEIQIKSFYKNDSVFAKREFYFNLKDGIKEIIHDTLDAPIEPLTTVTMIGFKKPYQSSSSAYKTSEKIAQRVLEHCLAYYISGSKISIVLEDDDKKIQLDDLYKELSEGITTEQKTILDHSFKLHHIKIYGTHQKANNIVYCANARDVVSENIGKKIGTSGTFTDDNAERFTYAVYVESKYLNDNVSADRMRFDIPREKTLIMPISMSEIEQMVVASIKEKLKTVIEKLNKEKQDMLSNYVSKEDPSMRAVLKYYPEVLDDIDPNDSPEEIAETLYRYRSKVDFEIRKKSAELLKTQLNSIEEIQNSFGDFEEKLEDFQKSSLSSYVLYRKFILQLFWKKLSLANDVYEKEKIVHDILFPQRTESGDIRFKDHNLWLVDERLAFHEFAASDNTFKQISTSDSKNRPDIFIVHEFDETAKKSREVSIVELKRPMRDQIESSEITKQLYDYADDIRGHKINMGNGRPFKIEENTAFHCYYVCDINEDVRTYAKRGQFSKLPDDLGFYNYNSDLKVHIQIIDYNKLVSDAEKRNYAFFEHLGVNGVKIQ